MSNISYEYLFSHSRTEEQCFFFRILFQVSPTCVNKTGSIENRYMYVRLASKNEKFENELAIPTDSIFYALSSDLVNVTIGGHVGCHRFRKRYNITYAVINPTCSPCSTEEQFLLFYIVERHPMKYVTWTFNANFNFA